MHSLNMILICVQKLFINLFPGFIYEKNNNTKQMPQLYHMKCQKI